MLYFLKAWDSRISNMTFPCVKCKIYKYTNMHFFGSKINCSRIIFVKFVLWLAFCIHHFPFLSSPFFMIYCTYHLEPNKMAGFDERLCLQWNDFKENVSSAFGDLREDKDFTDVTLACEDGQQVEAHKVVLIASSPFFLNILKRNKHPHPLIYMKGVKSENLIAMVDFLLPLGSKCFPRKS